MGLGRYGDKLDPTTLEKFISELYRVMKSESQLLISTSFGPNFLAFNEGYKFDFVTIKNLFKGFELIDYLIDNNSSHTVKKYTDRYTQNTDLSEYELGEYRVIFLNFKKVNI